MKDLLIISCIFGKQFKYVHQSPNNKNSYFFTNNKDLKDEITRVGKKYNLQTGRFIQRPITGLVDYHKRNILS